MPTATACICKSDGVLATGSSRSWIFGTKVGGRERELGLGSVERVSLAEARRKAVGARKLRDDVVSTQSRQNALSRPLRGWKRRVR